MKTKQTIIAIAAFTLMASASAGLLSGGKGLSTLSAAPSAASTATAPVDNTKVKSAADVQTQLLQAQDDVYNFHRSWNAFETKRVRNQYADSINPLEDTREQDLPFNGAPIGGFVKDSALRNVGLASAMKREYKLNPLLGGFIVGTGETLADFETKYGPHLVEVPWTQIGCYNVNNYRWNEFKLGGLVYEKTFVFGDMDKDGNPIQIKVYVCDGMVDSVSEPTYLPGLKAEEAAQARDKAMAEYHAREEQRRRASDAAEKTEKAKAPVVQSTGFKLKPRGFKE